MRALAAVLMAYTAVAAAYSAGARRGAVPPRARWIRASVALAAGAAAATLWPRSDGAILAGVCVAMSLSAMATLFVLIAPVWPRLAWSIAAIAPAAAAALAAIG
jgi:hypothetical protein